MESYFITLTYSEKNIPENMSLEKSHLQKFFKRLRKQLTSKVRYFAVGEYGTKKGRPHYHVILFTNGELAEKGKHSVVHSKGRLIKTLIESPIDKAWTNPETKEPIGIVQTQVIEDTEGGEKAARYTAGYCLKKLTTDERIHDVYPNRKPEFSCCSKGIGTGSARIIANALRAHDISIKGTGRKSDIGKTSGIYMVRIGEKKYPLGRTLREKVISQLGGDTRTKISKSINHQHKVFNEIIEHVEEKERYTEKRNADAAAKIVKAKRESDIF